MNYADALLISGIPKPAPHNLEGRVPWVDSVRGLN